MDLDNRHGEILVYMTPQENINSKSNTVVIACKRMIRQGGSKRRRFHCLVRNVSSSLNNVTDDVGVHEHVKGMFTLFQHTKYGIPVEAPKTKLQLVQTRLDSSCCSTWLGTNTVIFITFRTVKTWFFPPLNNNSAKETSSTTFSTTYQTSPLDVKTSYQLKGWGEDSTQKTNKPEF